MVWAAIWRSLAGMNVRQILAENVRGMRMAAGLSQEELAHRSAIHVTYLSGVENGRRNATIEVVARIAIALKTTPSRLLESQERWS
jgi:transcriptional regulator with XRE-family HTH domain